MGRTYAVLDVHGGVETKKVTIESLAQRIAGLESRPRSLNEDFQLEAYQMLAAILVQDLLVSRSPRKQK